METDLRDASRPGEELTTPAPVLLPTPMPYSYWILWVFKHQMQRICSKEEALAWMEQSRSQRKPR
jgi:hypothetical protein